MALIKCTYCEKEISDKAKVCPHCNQPASSAEETNENYKTIFCADCGTEFGIDTKTCPNCGCPVHIYEEQQKDIPQKVEVTSINIANSTAKIKKYGIILVILVVIGVALFFIISGIQKKNEEAKAAEYAANYSENLENASSAMLLGAVQAEDTGNLIKSVWYNAIYEEYDSTTDKYTRPNGYFVSDFNTALSNLFTDSSFQSDIEYIESNQTTVSNYMKELKNPPEEFEEAYEAIKELYDAYTELTNLVINPTGSLQSFAQNFNEADTDTANCYDELQLYIED